MSGASPSPGKHTACPLGHIPTSSIYDLFNQSQLAIAQGKCFLQALPTSIISHNHPSRPPVRSQAHSAFSFPVTGDPDVTQVFQVNACSEEGLMTTAHANAKQALHRAAHPAAPSPRCPAPRILHPRQASGERQRRSKAKVTQGTP